MHFGTRDDDSPLAVSEVYHVLPNRSKFACNVIIFLLRFLFIVVVS